MPDYKKMYAMLFNSITDVISQLQEIQKQAEELYLDDTDPQIIMINPENGE